MKLKHIALLIALALLAASCNFTLAEDVTPPPGYVPPTPMPTLGALFPASAPNIVDGAQIYMEKCAACHGNTGLGDGDKGKDLPVTVAPLGLADFARKAKPSAWFVQVTQGNIERFMPPFASLDDQQKWDVVAFALSLHIAPDQVEKGKTLCADCAKNFSDLKMMYALTEDDLIKIIKEGKDNIPAFGKDFTDEEAAAVAIYLRSLTFAAPLVATATPAPEATATAELATPSAATTPDGTQTGATPAATDQTNLTPAATAAAGVGKVSGSVENKTGKPLPADLKIKLTAYGHGSDPNAGMQEITSYDTTLNADGTFVFENIEIPANRIFAAETIFNGITYKSDFAVAKDGDTTLTLLPIKMFTMSSDATKLTVTQAHVFFDVKDGKLQLIEFLNISNASDIAISVPVVDNQMAIVKMPANMTNLGFDVQQGEATPVETADGFAMPPSDKTYGLAAGFETTYDNKSAEFEIPFVLGMPSGSILSTVGVKVEGEGLVDKGPTDIGSGTMYQVYEFSEVKPGSSMKLKLSGKPDATAAAPAVATDAKSNQPLLIGVGVFGAVLILVGAWFFIRDRNKKEEEESEDEDDEFEDDDSIMDAIIALDDLHRSGKISDEAYKKRREELKTALKKK